MTASLLLRHFHTMHIDRTRSSPAECDTKNFSIASRRPVKRIVEAGPLATHFEQVVLHKAFSAPVSLPRVKGCSAGDIGCTRGCNLGCGCRAASTASYASPKVGFGKDTAATGSNSRRGPLAATLSHLFEAVRQARLVGTARPAQ
jgi:hypothetical protein